MNAILDWGIKIIIWFQQFSPALDLPFKFLTFLGNEEFFLLFIPFLYWCLDRRIGARLTIVFLLSAYFNGAVKFLANQPRPFEYSTQIDQLTPSDGGGFPSGHTQTTLLIWGYLAAQFRRLWLWLLAGLLIILVPLSRVYLGVHFPTDLLGGFILGAVLLFLSLWLVIGIEAWFQGKGFFWQLGSALVVPSLLLILFWEKASITALATLMGFGTGMVLETRWIGFKSNGRWWKRGLRYVVGLGGLLALWLGLRLAFSALEPAFLFRFIRYGLVGLWTGLGAPWAFVRLRLAKRGNT